MSDTRLTVLQALRQLYEAIDTRCTLVEEDGEGVAIQLVMDAVDRLIAAIRADERAALPPVEPPSAEAVAWLREFVAPLFPRDGDGRRRLLDATEEAEDRYAREILRYVEGR